MTTERTLWPVWRCGVVRSGFHNGSACSSTDPHDGLWRCGWYAEFRQRVNREDTVTVRIRKHSDEVPQADNTTQAEEKYSR